MERSMLSHSRRPASAAYVSGMRPAALRARALPPVAALGVDAVHDWACVSYGRQDDGVLIEAERVVVGGAAVVTPSPSPAPY